MNARCMLVVTAALSAGSIPIPALAWDPWGDITHPERIIRNVEREGGNAIRDIPNIPRNVGREIENTGKTLDQWRLELQANAGAPAFEGWLQESKNTALRGGTLPIPPHIRAELAGFYDDDILNRVSYKVGDNGVLNLAKLSIRYGDANAVTLISVVVFANANGPNDPVLWAHELKHVQQFRDWGVRDFAVRYLRSWNSVEDEAYAAENNFAQQRSSRMAGQPMGQPSSFPQPLPFPQQPMLGAFCNVSGYRFGPGPINPVGSQCWVGSPNGPMYGQVTQ